ncbi:MAG: membrane protein insertase YidC, partial [Epsilonproteobacteria bacterium]|nr:membrane protein insertase YidC [Campylobacterota bacterium]
QQRVIVATILSFLFFVGYDYFFIPKPNLQAEQNRTQQITPKAAPATQATPKAAAPSSATSIETLNSSSKGANNEKTLVTIKGKNFDMIIDQFGRVSKFYLNGERYRDENGKRVQLFNDAKLPLPLEVRFSDSAVNTEAFKVPYTSNVSTINLNGKSVKIIMTQKLSKLTVKKILTVYPIGNYSLKLALSKPEDYFVSSGYRPDVKADGYTFHGVLIKEFDDTLTMIKDGDAKGDEHFANAKIVAASDRYYTTSFYNLKGGLDVYITKDKDKNPLPFVKGKQEYTVNGYIGVKELKILNSINKEMGDIVEYGWFTFIAKPVFLLLSFLHSILGNWGWAIVATTLIIRIILFPLTYKGMVSMTKMKELAPKIKELQRKYKGDPQKLNAHTMELYKKHGANPLGGCLPMLLQIPVFFALYRVLQNSAELQSAPWILWIHDLSTKDPYYILPILMGATMFWQQHISPNSIQDPTQAKIMKYLPVIFTFFFMTFPAGLTLYWFVNNLFSIAQQYYINSIFEKKKAKNKEVKVKE